MRGGSKGLPSKNLRVLHGKPLLAYTIEHALESELFEHVVVSTDSKKIAETSKSFGAETWFLRPTEHSTDEAPKIPAIRHAFLESEKYYRQNFDVVVDLDVTSPLRFVNDIKRAYQQFIDEDNDILFSACHARKNPYFSLLEIKNGRVEISKQSDKLLVRRQDVPEVFEANASIYIWKREALLCNNTLFTDKTSLYIMPEERSVDINSELEWEFVELIMDKRLRKMDD